MTLVQIQASFNDKLVGKNLLYLFNICTIVRKLLAHLPETAYFALLVKSSHLDNVNDILSAFEPISLEEMDRVKLLNRTDTKFLIPRNLLPSLLEEAKPYYQVLEIKGKRTNDYRTIYFDTPDFSLYTKHANGKLNRYKLRYRKYLDSDLCFLEIKFKNNKGRTIKSRIRVEDFEEQISQDSGSFIMANSPLIPEELEAKLANEFTRITLVHKTNEERLTIDLNVAFDHENKQKDISEIVIAEVKLDKDSSGSDFIDIMKAHHILPYGMSKYCVGTVLLYDDLVKYNNFKQRLHKINKLKSNGNAVHA